MLLTNGNTVLNSLLQDLNNLMTVRSLNLMELKEELEFLQSIEEAKRRRK